MIKNVLVSFFLLASIPSSPQDPIRLKDQVNELADREYNFNTDKKLVVFAGSSSIRMWKDVQSCFPNYNVVNNGFGGSQFSDLIYFYKELILQPSPDILFIYEGDNDTASGKKPSIVFKQAKQLISNINNDLPKTNVILISPKPCIANWGKKDNYIKLNKKLEKFCKRKNNVDFADVWRVMVDENGNLNREIFIADGDHMNKSGYDLWEKVIGEFLKD